MSFLSFSFFPCVFSLVLHANYFRDSYIVYIALIAGYLVLILFFFPETRYGSGFCAIDSIHHMTVSDLSFFAET